MKQKKINLERMIQDALYDYDKTVVVDKDKLNVIINIMREFGKQLLELAAENAEVNSISTSDDSSGFIHEVDKQLILDTINQVE